MPNVNKAVDAGVKAAMIACRDAQAEKQIKILELGLRALAVDKEKFKNIPEVRDAIEKVIREVEAAIELFNEETVPDVFIEDYIDIGIRRKDETPLEFELKKDLNVVYKAYLEMIPGMEGEITKAIDSINKEKEKELSGLIKNFGIEGLDPSKQQEMTMSEIFGKMTDDDIERFEALREKVSNQYEDRKEEEIKVVKLKYKNEIKAAENYYQEEVVPVLKQLNVEIASKVFRVAAENMNEIYKSKEMDGLVMDVNSLTAYIFLGKSLSDLAKVNIVSSIGLPVIKSVVEKTIPPNEKEKDSLSEKTLKKLTASIGTEVGGALTGIVDAPLENLEKAIEYSEKRMALKAPDGTEVGFMDVYSSESDVSLAKKSSSSEKPTNFFAAIEQLSNANGAIAKIGALGDFMAAISSGSKEGCLDTQEHVIGYMSQGLRNELMRQRFEILIDIRDTLEVFDELPDSWRQFKAEIDELVSKKASLDEAFNNLNEEYPKFKSQFDEKKKAYLAEKEKYDKLVNDESEPAFSEVRDQMREEQARSYQKERDKIVHNANERKSELLMDVYKKHYRKKFNTAKELSTSNKKIKAYFEKNPNPKLAQDLAEIEKKYDEQTAKKVAEMQDKVFQQVEKKYQSKLMKSASKFQAIKHAKERCDACESEMAELSRNFYEKSSEFRGERDNLEYAVNESFAKLGTIKSEDEPHLWQLQKISASCANELKPLDVVVSVLGTVSDFPLANSITYSDIFEASVEPVKRKMQAEVSRGQAADLGSRIQQGSAEMMGANIVQIKAGSKIKHLKTFRNGLQATIDAEARFDRIQDAITHQNEHTNDIIREVAQAHTSEEVGGWKSFWHAFGDFFKSLNPFGKKEEKPDFVAVLGESLAEEEVDLMAENMPKSKKAIFSSLKQPQKQEVSKDVNVDENRDNAASQRTKKRK